MTVSKDTIKSVICQICSCLCYFKMKSMHFYSLLDGLK